MISAPVFGMKRICVSIAIMLVGVTCFAADKQPKLILHFDVMSGEELKLNGTPAGFVVAGELGYLVEPFFPFVVLDLLD